MPLRVLIPWYNYPNHWVGEPGYQWPAMAAGHASDSEIVAIINPNSGPGGAGDPNADYVVGLNALKAAGLKMIGYVSTNYGNRAIADVKADIDKYEADYLTWLTGIFLDETPNATGKEAYYSEVHDYIRAKATVDDMIVMNPGTPPIEAYMSYCDVMVMFETTQNNFAAHTPPAYASGYDSDKFCALSYRCATQEAMESDLTTVYQTHGYGYVYWTDDGADGNPWDELPTYWDEEIAKVRALNAVVPPTPVTPVPPKTRALSRLGVSISIGTRKKYGR